MQAALAQEKIKYKQQEYSPYYKPSSANNDEKYYSPYYKGLLAHSFPATPTRESHATSTITWTSFSLSFIAKIMQELTSSCFHFKPKRSSDHHHHHHNNKKPAASEWETTASAGLDSSFHSSSSTNLPLQMEEERKKKSKIEDILVTKEKPLRESLLEPTAEALVLVPTTTPPILTSPQVVTVDQEEEDIKHKFDEANKDMVGGVWEFSWAKKYQPHVLEDFICNKDKATQLLAQIREGSCGHFIFEGPPGVGKRTMIWAMLREAFGSEIIQDYREECKAFNLKGEVIGQIEVNVKESPQHVEVNLSELKGYEKHVILELIKENPNWMSDKDLPCTLGSCRAIILYEADKLSMDAILYIKWLLERYKACNKIFFCCSDVSKLQAIKTLCTVVHLLPPSMDEIVEVLEFIAKQEGIELPHNLAEKIAANSKSNLRQAIRSFEATWLKGYPFAEDQVVLTGWEDDIANIAKNMVKEQSPKQLYIIRGKLQNLIEHDLSPEFIFKSLVEELKKHVDEQMKPRVEVLYSEYITEENMFESIDKATAQNRHDDQMPKKFNDQTRKNIQQFMKIEEFIAKFMSCYKGAIKSLQRDSAT
jgi:replication factor C subunit 3/5